MFLFGGVDQLCINQGDVQERNQQVQLMRKIYRNSDTVRIWLDIDIKPNNPAVIKLQGLSNQSTKQDLGVGPSFWKFLSVVFKHPYWRRVWIQQEISNTTSLEIQCWKELLPVVGVYHYLRITYDRISGADINTPV
jgi:hypothetical protein